MRNSHSKPARTMANRRAYRPDRQVYRQLRRGTRRGSRTLLWIEIALAAMLVVGAYFLIRWIF